MRNLDFVDVLVSDGVPPGFFRRVKAFFLDYLLIAGYLVVLGIVFSTLAFGPLKDVLSAATSTPWRADLLAFVTAVLPVILYFALMESSQNGATWGKRRMGLHVTHTSGAPLGRGRALLRSAVKFLPWQLAHTCLFHIPGWPLDPQEPPVWVLVGLILMWVVVGLYLVTLGVGPSRRTPYDWIAGSRVVERR